VSLNIKNERVHDLVRQAATLTGKSQTSVVEEALRRYLDELERESSAAARIQRIAEILAEFDRSGLAERMPVNTDFLYDENGLPA
jgi:antitoxin VapB